MLVSRWTHFTTDVKGSRSDSSGSHLVDGGELIKERLESRGGLSKRSRRVRLSQISSFSVHLHHHYRHLCPFCSTEMDRPSCTNDRVTKHAHKCPPRSLVIEAIRCFTCHGCREPNESLNNVIVELRTKLRGLL